MKLLLLVAAALIVLHLRPALADPAENYCFQLWPADVEARWLCINLQEHARSDFFRYLRAHGLQLQTIDAAAARGSAPAGIARYCKNRWLPRYTMIMRCVRRNVEAATRAKK